MKIFLLLFLCLTFYKECSATNSTGNQHQDDSLGAVGIAFILEEFYKNEDGIRTVTMNQSVTFEKPAAWLFGLKEVRADMIYQDLGLKQSVDLSLTDVESSQTMGGLKLIHDLKADTFQIEKLDDFHLNILGADVTVKVVQNPQTPNQLRLELAITYGEHEFKMNAAYSVVDTVYAFDIDVHGQTWNGRAVFKTDKGEYSSREIFIDLDLHLEGKDVRLELNLPRFDFYNFDELIRAKYNLFVDNVMVLAAGSLFPVHSFEGFWANYCVYIRNWEICSMNFALEEPSSNNIFRLKTECNGHEQWLFVGSDQEPRSLSWESSTYEIRVFYEGAEYAKGLIKWNLRNWRELIQFDLNLIENGQNGTKALRGGLNATINLEQRVGDLNITFDGAHWSNERIELLFKVTRGYWLLNFQDLRRHIKLTSGTRYFGFPHISEDWDNMSSWLQKQFFFHLDMPKVSQRYVWPYDLDVVKIVGDTTGSLFTEFSGMSFSVAPLSKSNGQMELKLYGNRRKNETVHIIYDGKTVTGNGTIYAKYSPDALYFHHDIVGDVKRGSLVLSTLSGFARYELESVYVNLKRLEISYREQERCDKGKILLGFDELNDFFMEHRSPFNCPWHTPDMEEESWRLSLSTIRESEPESNDFLLSSKLKVNNKLDTSFKIHSLENLEGNPEKDIIQSNSFASNIYNAQDSVARPLIKNLMHYVYEEISPYINFKSPTDRNHYDDYNDYGSYY